jgi:SURF4 family
VRDGGCWIQGQVVCRVLGARSEHIQRVCEQLVGSPLGSSSARFPEVSVKRSWVVGSEELCLTFFFSFDRYDFFQTLCAFFFFLFLICGHEMTYVLLAIVGGLILLVNMGPGGLSVDEKKKTY